MSNVLIVDDSAVDRRLASGLLKKDPSLSIETAENGIQALARMEQSTPHLVLTDLQMPEMNGLELVTAIRVRYPHVPVILMTAHGSEAIAVEALEQGAASYVPKTQLADTLFDTVRQILSVVAADHDYRRLMGRRTKAALGFTLENDSTLIEPLVDLVQQNLAEMDLCDANERCRVGVALTHALLNALYRGNLEITHEQIQQDRERLLLGQQANLVDQRRGQPPYRDRRIRVKLQMSPDEARMTVRDDGPGFSLATLPAPGDPAAMQQDAGRGLVLIRALVDEAIYNDQGNEVTLVKRRALNQ